MDTSDDLTRLRPVEGPRGRRPKRSSLVKKIVGGVLVAVLPSVFFLSDAPIWWNRAHLLWNEYVHPRAEAASVSPIPLFAVVVPLTATKDPTYLAVIDVGSGRVLTRLTADGFGAGTPTITADRRVVYFSDPSGNVHVSDADGNNGRIVFRANDTCKYVRHVSISKVDNGHLLLQCRDRPAENQTDYHDFFQLVDLQGLVVRKLDTTSSKLDDPSLSPDGRYLAYWGSSDTDVPGYPGGAIFVLDLAATQEPMQLTSMSGSRDTDPAWSPDSRTLAFSREKNDQKSVFKISATGGTPKRLVENAQKASWSTDGDSLVAVRERAGGGNELIRFTKNGRSVTVCSKPQRTIYAPVWSGR